MYLRYTVGLLEKPAVTLHIWLFSATDFEQRYNAISQTVRSFGLRNRDIQRDLDSKSLLSSVHSAESPWALATNTNLISKERQLNRIVRIHRTFIRLFEVKLPCWLHLRCRSALSVYTMELYDTVLCPLRAKLNSYIEDSCQGSLEATLLLST